MSNRPDWCPADVWESAENAARWADGLYAEGLSDSEKLEVVEAIAAAILAERERCVEAITSMAIPHYMALGTVNGALHKIDPGLPPVEFEPPKTPTITFRAGS